VGDLLLVLIFAGIMSWGNRLEYCPGGEYTCPSYCEADHIHFEKDCNETQKKQKAHKQRVSESDSGTTIPTDGDTVTVTLVD
jgi:hypothetical protein